MERVQFAVSAKTARLIGRENISDVDGAVIELIKNAYDADATCVYVQFCIPFPTVPQWISYDLAASVWDKGGLEGLFRYYQNDGKRFVKKKNLTTYEELLLADYLFACNTIIVMDNGCGMNEETLRTAWMNIGTNDKEEKKISAGGRIKTGAKGIGRFALDKLSMTTTVYTKSTDDFLKKWSIDWRQFDTAIMLEEVTASVENFEAVYFDLAKRVAARGFKSFEEYSWDTGTMIILNPTRENWSEAHFSRINRNLKSLFPSTNSSHFDIYVNNQFYPKYSFFNERFSLKESDYDYRIIGSFDGKDTLMISIDRNEIDTRKIKQSILINEHQQEVMLSEFWTREAFQKEKYHRSDYAKQITFALSASSLTRIDPNTIEQVGPFQVELYFLKNTGSKIEIVKPIVANRRKEILENYSGIKLYRDGFKVRPYGEEGQSFDWIGLGERARKSPGAVSNDGPWRVRTNQIIGAIRISKESNPLLVDMANREGLATNETYFAFVSIIEKIIETFEGDRQYVFREYSSWLKKKMSELSKTREIVETVKEKQQVVTTELNKGEKENTEDKREKADKEDKERNTYSRHEYEEAVLELERSNERKERALKTMMLYSSAGVMTNTFSHEISRIRANAGSRMQQLRYSVNRLIGKDGYQGNPLFNPLIIIDQTEKVDRLLESWLEVIMSGVEDSTFNTEKKSIYFRVQRILDSWKPLLQQKLININPVVKVGDMDEVRCPISDIDLYIILNNFVLNSAWFLERASVKRREISVTIENMTDKVVMLLENNGPPLDKMFANNPERIFYPGESSKKNENGEGTGLGLWITKTVIDDISGEIHCIEKTEGFGLRISLPK